MSSLVAEADSPAARRVIWRDAAGLVLVTVVAYAGTFAVPFVFDDIPAIVENPTIRSLTRLGDVLAPPHAGGLTVAGRPLVNLSLALNHAISGPAVWSYHAFNLAVHVCAGLALFGLVRRTLLRPALRGRFGVSARWLAWMIAAVWLLHPLQTESVTYVVQRAESLAGLFYLLTLYAFARGAVCHPLDDNPPSFTSGRDKTVCHLMDDKPPRRDGRGWLAVSGVACVLGMASKEVAVTAPLIALLYDRTFVAGSVRAAWAARWKTHLALAASWLLLAALVLGTRGRGGTAGFGAGISAWSYALTQCEAIVRYLGLCVWPHPLVFDYGPGTARDLPAVLPQAGLVLALLAVTGWMIARRPLAGFLGAFFFALLAPSSSFVPVVTQTIAEHRMYLPLAAVVVLVVLGWHRWLRESARAAGAGVALVLLATTVVRNAEYDTEVSIWRTAAERRPGNARAHNNLGQALFRAGRVAEAKACYERALALQPRYPETHYNLGVALAQEGRGAAALASYAAALRFAPDYPEAHNNLGNALVRAGRPAEALPHFEEALRLKPDLAEAHNNLGNALLASGRADAAAERFRRALALKPIYPEAHYNLGNALAGVGRMAGALAQYREAIAQKPGYAAAHVNAGNASLQLERPADAIAHYEQALALDPRLGEAHFNLGSVQLDAGRWADAAAHFESVLRLDPDSAPAHRALGYALAKLDRTQEAIAHLEAFLRVEPGDEAVRDLLAQVRQRR
ncbi:MAG: tetratricopeptide repeat protein [Verrucomicrobia bacterium]|nr:tetratricopeptide repeat protein [Verrucomicrobiota bacterium]